MSRLLFITTAASVLVAGAGSGVEALAIAGTSFENEAAATGVYNGVPAETAGDDSADLLNESDATVDSTITSSTAGDLGFNARYVDNTSNSYETNRIGVVDEKARTGSNSYQAGDVDDLLVLEFDEVDLTAFTDVDFSIWISFEGNTENDDSISVVLDLTGASDITVVEKAGLFLGEPFNEYTADIPDSATAARLVVNVDTDANSEELWIDDVSFVGVPEPASLALVGAGSLLMLRRRKR
jgi:hypothetical protein